MAMALPENVMDIVDPLMFFEEDEEDVNNEKNEDDIEVRAIIKEDHHVNVSSRIKDCSISVFQIGLSYSTNRMSGCQQMLSWTKWTHLETHFLNLRRETQEEWGMLTDFI